MRKAIIILSLILLTFVSIFLYDKFAYMKVVVKFDDLEPIERKMKVYFKGFYVGKTSRIYPDKEYKNTFMELKLKPSNINLPQNIQAKITKKNLSSPYVNLIYPDSPSLAKLKHNAEIKGILTKDINSVIGEKLSSDEIGEIVEDTMGLIDNANAALSNLSDIFLDVRTVINESKNDVKMMTSSLAKTSYNLEQISSKLNTSLDQEMIQNSADNVEDTLKNIESISEEIKTSTIPTVNGILTQTYSSMRNINEITCGVKKTLKKQFGFGRLIFGRPVEK